MRRGLSFDALGDLFDLPLVAVLSVSKPDGTVLSRPVWHRWESGRFVVQFPAGDRKIAMLERDDRLTLLLAENAFPYRAIEVRGRARISEDRYRERAIEICRRYVDAYDPGTPVESYVSAEPGRIVEIDADVTHCWDYADDEMMPT
ncbi:MAG TPA: pyridoxamine 5'-phosphate oxidase family protein [Candidatus Limnocylindrales bacterium]|nr:pyridoxamine 5'-phosphate oxidase family protein [Candidatus Limnocylindrales bacterium]